MSGYTKLFGSIIASTIWRESKETKIVWITMLAMADKRGIVEASLPGLADMARVSIEEAKTATEILSSPDSFSRTKDFEGRRIAAVDGGWLILNHAKYRMKMSADERREYNRLKQQEFRAKQRGASTDCQQPSMTVNDSQSLLPESALSAHTEAEADPEADKTVGAAVPDGTLADPDGLLPVLLTFPCVGRQPTWGLDEAFVGELKQLYPTVDPLAECRLALSKIEHGAVTKKTAKGMPKFLYAWMDRAANGARPANWERHANNRTSNSRGFENAAMYDGVREKL